MKLQEILVLVALVMAISYLAYFFIKKLKSAPAKSGKCEGCAR